MVWTDHGTTTSAPPNPILAPTPDASPGTTAGGARILRRIASTGLVGADIIALAIAAAAAYGGRQILLDHASDLVANVIDAAGILAVGWFVSIWLFGGYRARYVPAGAELYRAVLRATLASAGIAGTVVFLGGIELSRVYFVLFFLIGPVLLLAIRFTARRLVNRARAGGRFREAVIMVGALPHVDDLARTISRESWLGYDIVGALTPDGDPRATSAFGIPVLGSEEQLMDVIEREHPAVLLFTAGSESSAEEFRRTSWRLEEYDIDVIVAPALTEIAADRLTMRPVAGLPLVHLDKPRSRDSLRWYKRLFDITASALGLLLISPLLLIIALVIKVHDGGPVIFRQQRVGRGGETFEFFKFRSMVTDAERVLSQLQSDSRQDSGNAVMFKMRSDPRITRPGRFLRRYSLDELPQLYNVLKGDMSLVGPRPALPREASGYNDIARRRLTIRPGITGLWQVSGRSELSWDETVRLDVYYVDNWSFMQDLQILTRTIRAVLAPSGAY